LTATWLDDIADKIWETSGPPPFPRDVERAAINASLPLFFKSLSDLTVERVEAWIAQRHGSFKFLCTNRALRGCIVALRGKAVIFTDPIDSANERRFTQAHELAHFLLDYQEPRQRALAVFGENIRPILDGDRPPTTTERVHAALADVKIGTYHYLMDRDNDGLVVETTVQSAETRANRLALHLLAPSDAVLPHLPIAPAETERDAFCHDAMQILTDTFGLPAWVASEYALQLWTHAKRPSSRKWLGL
jgi:hypothetical protein